jgi:hypothetical protein
MHRSSVALRHSSRPLLARARALSAAPRRAAAAPPRAMEASLAGPVFFLDDFAIRQWDDENYSGTRMKCGAACAWHTQTTAC